MGDRGAGDPFLVTAPVTLPPGTVSGTIPHVGQFLRSFLLLRPFPPGTVLFWTVPHETVSGTVSCGKVSAIVPPGTVPGTVPRETVPSGTVSFWDVPGTIPRIVLLELI